MKVCLFVAAAGAALSDTGLAAWHARGRADAPASLPDLARAAEAAGYRVVPTYRGGDPRDGFYAVPADDPRGWAKLSLLLRGEPGWGRAVLCSPVRGDWPPAGKAVYTGEGFQLDGE